MREEIGVEVAQVGPDLCTLCLSSVILLAGCGSQSPAAPTLPLTYCSGTTTILSITALPPHELAVGEEATFTFNLSLPLATNYYVWITPLDYEPKDQNYEYSPSGAMDHEATGVQRSVRLCTFLPINYIPGTVHYWYIKIQSTVDSMEVYQFGLDYEVNWVASTPL